MEYTQSNYRNTSHTKKNNVAFCKKSDRGVRAVEPDEKIKWILTYRENIYQLIDEVSTQPYIKFKRQRELFNEVQLANRTLVGEHLKLINNEK